jgi:hypothetical protein
MTPGGLDWCHQGLCWWCGRSLCSNEILSALAPLWGKIKAFNMNLQQHMSPTHSCPQERWINISDPAWRKAYNINVILWILYDRIRGLGPNNTHDGSPGLGEFLRYADAKKFWNLDVVYQILLLLNWIWFLLLDYTFIWCCIQGEEFHWKLESNWAIRRKFMGWIKNQLNQFNLCPIAVRIYPSFL